MDRKEASERTRRLLDTVERCCDLLLDAKEGTWGPWLDAVHRELMAHDPRGLDRLLSGFGSTVLVGPQAVGSFSDLVLSSTSGHAVAEEETASLNSELDALRSTMFKDAQALRRFRDAP